MIQRVAVGTLIAERPPHRSVHAAFPHTAPASGPTGTPLSRRIVCAPAPDTPCPVLRPVACFAGSHSPWPPPLAPPAPQRIAPPCSSASQLLWRRPTSRARASSATAPRLPDADLHGWATQARRGISQLPTRSFCA